MTRPAPRHTAAKSGIAVRQVSPGDVPVIAELHAACFSGGLAGEVWNAAAIARILAMPGAHGVLAFDDGTSGQIGTGGRAEPTPLGFALGRLAAGEAEILTLGVSPRARRAGLGRTLLTSLMAQASAGGAGRLYLEVAQDNAAALGLYSAAGFLQVGRRPGYYRRPDGPAAALVLALDLSPPRGGSADK